MYDSREHQGDDCTHGDTDRHRHADPAQQNTKGFTDQRLRNEPNEQAGDGDAQLRAREHERRALRHSEGTDCRGIPRRRAGTETIAVHRHVGELLSHEVAVSRDDHQDDHNAQQQEEQGFDHENVTSSRCDRNSRV